jgi:AraC family transcriptional regulator
MTERDSRAEYQRRMHRVLEYVDRHLDQPLSLAILAQVAHFSPFHFHRLFAAWMGETLGDYLSRRRIEVAAMRLASQPQLPILTLGLAVGFGSAEAFSRAFRKRFGSAPTAWRREQSRRPVTNRNPGQIDSKPDQDPPGLPTHPVVSSNPLSETPMNVTLINRKPAAIAYLRHLGPYGEPIAAFWQHTYYPWAHTHQLLGVARYGISHDDPSITAAEQCRYDACAEVPPDFVATGHAVKTTIPGGQYASLRFNGTAGEISSAWQRLLRDWLPSSGLQLDARPCFEYYPTNARYDAKSGVFECDICIPVTSL